MAAHAYRKDYPRPQFVRENYTLLDGEWKFAFDRWRGDATDFAYLITVPFTYETVCANLKKIESDGNLKKIEEQRAFEYVCYQRSFSIHKKTDCRLLLHFEGVDHEATVWVNGRQVGSHRGAYARFSFDITEYVVDGDNELVVQAHDTMDAAVPRGKQRWMKENYGCWYVQTTGIWKSVWMEEVGCSYIGALKITPDWANRKIQLHVDTINVKPQDSFWLKAEVTFENQPIKEALMQITESTTCMELYLDRYDIFEWGVYEWRCDAPSLYDVKLMLLDGVEASARKYDEVASYFGLREIRIENSNILLNSAPLYQRLILDQGYWKDSHLTPPDEEAIIKDIDSILALGYNGVRKHQKIEDERFLYWCDVKGLLVWSEMGAAYRYSDAAVEEFTKEWMEIVRQNYSHPSIITWTPFNESWGIGLVKTSRTHQHFTEAIYHLTKAFDSNRPVIVNDGWEHTVSDIITLHDYEEDGEVFFKRYMEYKDEILANTRYHCWNKSAFAQGFSYQGQPVIISEFGGIAFNEDGGWGYGNKVTSEEDFIRRFDSITTAIKRLPYVCGYCYTQVSDVQQEINGLLTADRRMKISPEIICKINTRNVSV